MFHQDFISSTQSRFFSEQPQQSEDSLKSCPLVCNIATKGQLISKELFGILESRFFQKKNQDIQINYYDTSGRLVFVRFFEEFEDTKKTFRS